MPSPRFSRTAGVLLLFFAIISAAVALHVTDSWDSRFLVGLALYRTPTLTWLMQRASDAGSGMVDVPLAFLITAILWRADRRATAKRYLAVGVSGEVLYALLKEIFHRPRPTVISHLGEAGWYSYPSGHSMLAPIIWSFGLLLLATLPSWRALQLPLRILAVVMPLVIGVSRLYLGVHYPSDVLGAWCVGVMWVLIWSDGALTSRES